MRETKRLRQLRITAIVTLIVFFLLVLVRITDHKIASVGAAAINKLFLPLVVRNQQDSSQATSTATTTPTETLTPTSTATGTETPTSTPGTPQTPLFGVGMTHLTTNGGLDLMAAANITWVRHPGVLWSRVEPIQGNYDWSVLADLENELLNAASKGIQVVLLVQSTPEWARKIAGTGPSCGPIAADKLAAFGDFMHALVARYSVPPYNVKHWEMWNEEDAFYFSGDPGYGCWGDESDAYYGGGYYAEMLKVVYPQIKAANSQAQVLIGGLLLDCDPRGGCDAAGRDPRPSMFLEGILRNDGAAFFDGISFHAYDYYLGVAGQYANPNWTSAWNTTGPVVVGKSRFIQAVLSQYGVTGKFLMNTETALVCGTTGQEPPCLTDLFANTKVYYVAQSYAVAIAEGLRANLWYNVFGWRNSGLLNDDLSLQPAYTALKFTVSELTNSAYAGIIMPADIGGEPGVKGYKFVRNDRRIWVLWSLDGNTHLGAFSSTPLAAWDSLGNSVPPAASMNITLNPLFLEWNP